MLENTILISEPFTTLLAACHGITLTVPLIAALLSLVAMPGTRTALAGVAAWTAVAVQVTVTVAAGACLWTLVQRSNIAALDIGGAAPAMITTHVPLLGTAIAVDAGTALLWLALELSTCTAIAALWPHFRSTKSPLAIALTITTAGAVLFIISGVSATVCATATAAASLLGSLTFAVAQPSRAGTLALWRIGAVHRVGDVALALSIFVVGSALGGLSGEDLLRTTFEIDPNMTLTSGALAGFTRAQAWEWAAVGVYIALLSRVLQFPLVWLARDAVSSTGAVVGFVHGIAFAGAGCLLAWRLLPALSLAPIATFYAGRILLAHVVLTAILALLSRDMLRIDVLLVLALSGLSMLFTMSLDAVASYLPLVLLLLCVVPMCAATAMVVEQTQLRDPYATGGLEHVLPRSHTVRLLATGALVGPFLSGAFALVHGSAGAWLAPWLGLPAVLVIFLASGLCTVAGFRVLHLTFTGKARSSIAIKSPPLSVKDVAAMLTVLPAVGVFLIGIPRGALLLLPFSTTYVAPLEGMLLPLRHTLASLQPLVLPAREHPPLSPSQAAALALATPVVGYLASLALFRGGPRGMASGLAQKLERPFVALAALLDRESGVAEDRALRLSRLIAVNLAPAVLDTILRRIPSLIGSALAIAMQVISGGSPQRSMLLALSTTALWMWWWL